MALSPQAIRLLLNDPRKYNSAYRDEGKEVPRNKKERLLVKYLFERDTVEEDYILNVNAPADSNVTQAILQVADSVQQEIDAQEVLEPAIFNIILDVVARAKNILPDILRENLTKYKEYFDFCNSKRNKTIVTEKEISEVKSLNKAINYGYGDFYNIFKTYQYNVDAQILEFPTKDSSPFDEFFLKNAVFPAVVKKATQRTDLNDDEAKKHLYRGETVQRVLPKTSKIVTCYIDSLDYLTKENTAHIALIRLIDKPIKDMEDVIFGPEGLFIDIGMINVLLRDYLSIISDKKRPEISYTLFVVDPQGYQLTVSLTPKSISKCSTQFESLLNNNILPHYRERKFNTYARYLPHQRVTL